MIKAVRRRLFLKFLGLTIGFGLCLGAVVLLAYHGYRRQELIGEMSAVIGVVATKLDHPLSRNIGAGEVGEARRLLGLFGAFPYVLCAEYDGAAGPRAAFWPIPCAHMERPGQRLTIPSSMGKGGFTILLSDEEIESILGQEFLVLSLLTVATGLAMTLSMGLVFGLIVNRPLARLIAAMARFEDENVPEKVDWRSSDEIGRVVYRYNAMLDREVGRVRELDDRHAETRALLGQLEEAYGIISDSIAYAVNIQRAILPAPQTLDSLVSDHFVLWEPRDRVGGDFYWCCRWGDGTLVLLGDCTGHGIPGAFMTMIASAGLRQALSTVPPGEVGTLAGILHASVQHALGQDAPTGPSDDGLEAAIVHVSGDGSRLRYAGARIPLILMTEGVPRVIKGTRSGMGYRGIPRDQAYAVEDIPLAPGTTVYLTTDGLLEQVGGRRGRMFGKTRFLDLLAGIEGQPMATRKSAIHDALAAYQGDALRRDDVTVIGFTP
jgi:serine phosphatase RsbU (regulator of sigma subunit)